jgi:high-affinity iron transporter
MVPGRRDLGSRMLRCRVCASPQMSPILDFDDFSSSTLIFFMALAILRMEHSTTKWRAKLHAAIAGHTSDRTTKTSNYVLFLLPFITVLREGLEAVVFVAGVALGSDPSTIPGAVLLGVFSGIGVGLAIWMWGTHSSMPYSLVSQLS